MNIASISKMAQKGFWSKRKRANSEWVMNNGWQGS
jgi:hypothetical protein